MRIEHVAMYVNDLEAAKNFLRNIWEHQQMRDIIIKRRTSVHIFSHLMMAQGLR